MAEVSEAQVQQPGTLDRIIDWTTGLAGKFVDYTRAQTGTVSGAQPVTAPAIGGGFDIKWLLYAAAGLLILKKLKVF